MSRDLVQVPLYRLAHSRTGDKGDTSNISAIAWRDDLYPILVEQLTAVVVASWFAYRQPRRVTRHLLPTLHAMNFVLDGVLDGGVNESLNLDTHGKALSFHLLNLPLAVSPGLAASLPDVVQAVPEPGLPMGPSFAGLPSVRPPPAA